MMAMIPMKRKLWMSGVEWMEDGVDAYFLELLNRIVTVIIFSPLTSDTPCPYNCIGL